MDPLSITPVPSTSAAQAPAAPAATVDANRKPGLAAARPTDIERRTAAPEPEANTAPRDSRSVQYLVQDNRVITTIVDDNSKKVVVQIPDAELIRIAKSIDRMQGFFIEQKA